ncbi:hypothetical protein MHBO_002561 [Bonamia ostreae]|uniref:Uncharacterized protein n=1 Tax=Bonamia ostreae TaxID=126728 RepID=A0ABV2AMT3_9EUKA
MNNGNNNKTKLLSKEIFTKKEKSPISKNKIETQSYQNIKLGTTNREFRSEYKNAKGSKEIFDENLKTDNSRKRETNDCLRSEMGNVRAQSNLIKSLNEINVSEKNIAKKNEKNIAKMDKKFNAEKTFKNLNSESKNEVLKKLEKEYKIEKDKKSPNKKSKKDNLPKKEFLKGKNRFRIFENGLNF